MSLVGEGFFNEVKMKVISLNKFSKSKKIKVNKGNFIEQVLHTPSILLLQNQKILQFNSFKSKPASLSLSDTHTQRFMQNNNFFPMTNHAEHGGDKYFYIHVEKV